MYNQTEYKHILFLEGVICNHLYFLQVEVLVSNTPYSSNQIFRIRKKYFRSTLFYTSMILVCNYLLNMHT